MYGCFRWLWTDDWMDDWLSRGKMLMVDDDEVWLFEPHALEHVLVCFCNLTFPFCTLFCPLCFPSLSPFYHHHKHSLHLIHLMDTTSQHMTPQYSNVHRQL